MDHSHDDAGDLGQQPPSSNGADRDRDDIVRTAATIGIIGVGAALIEVGLIPGMIIGVAAAYASEISAEARVGPAADVQVGRARRLQTQPQNT
jgi:hypothetical protein